MHVCIMHLASGWMEQRLIIIGDYASHNLPDRESGQLWGSSLLRTEDPEAWKEYDSLDKMSEDLVQPDPGSRHWPNPAVTRGRRGKRGSIWVWCKWMNGGGTAV